jgi:hypothetical protein
MISSFEPLPNFGPSFGVPASAGSQKHAEAWTPSNGISQAFNALEIPSRSD